MIVLVSPMAGQGACEAVDVDRPSVAVGEGLRIERVNVLGRIGRDACLRRARQCARRAILLRQRRRPASPAD